MTDEIPRTPAYREAEAQYRDLIAQVRCLSRAMGLRPYDDRPWNHDASENPHPPESIEAFAWETARMKGDGLWTRIKVALVTMDHERLKALEGSTDE